ncbi:hypothetical protein [Kitasatospora sp. GP82]|uniref:hypothetical protein n=1 Tax=Kitasatospora sp. GP82 TaxID=3035089 RepID=UPI002475ED6D|nr:hypothetical protein [Kitasatospora sp. GP82]MDH6129299.1 hypothetical protein [Kitasatospora sp. GP82]
MEIFEALDATECVHSAAALAGVDPKTVSRYARMRDLGFSGTARSVRPKLIDSFVPKIEEWVERSQGLVRPVQVRVEPQCGGVGAAAPLNG